MLSQVVKQLNMYSKTKVPLNRLIACYNLSKVV